jgi:hypothetical protein
MPLSEAPRPQVVRSQQQAIDVRGNVSKRIQLASSEAGHRNQFQQSPVEREECGCNTGDKRDPSRPFRLICDLPGLTDAEIEKRSAQVAQGNPL